MTVKERWIIVSSVIIAVAFLGVWVALVILGHTSEAKDILPIVTAIAFHFYGKYSNVGGNQNGDTTTNKGL